jgi:ribonuclease P/MRP protein subunit POP7
MAVIDSQQSGPTNIQAATECRGEKNHSKKAGSKASKPPSALLADITFDRKNKPQPRLPPNHKIQKRPITHPPIASPYAGPDVQKVVYVSRTTPIMAAVKRVRKLLEQAEKRNLQREGVLGDSKRAGSKTSTEQSKNPRKQEEILVKGSGRAIAQAVKVGEWFKRHAGDGDGGWVVNIRPATVKVVDDIVEDPTLAVGNSHSEGSWGFDGSRPEMTHLERTEDHMQKDGDNQPEDEDHAQPEEDHPSQAAETERKETRPTPKKRKRPTYDDDDVPEARSRFINAIEIAVSLKS